MINNEVAIDKFLRRMDEAKQLRDIRDNKDYIGSGVHWQGKLTVPEAPDFELQENWGLESVKCISKPVVWNGEIVRDAWILVPRHLNHP